MRYFQQFPFVVYNDKLAIDITKRVKVFEGAKNTKTIYYSYTIKDGETPDSVAYNYYGNSYYFWVIFLVNSIIDPFFQWPLSQTALDKHIVKKYSSLSAAQSLILKYKMNPEVFYISKYENNDIISEEDYLLLGISQQQNYELAEDTREPFYISKDTYDNMDSGHGGYSPVYAYDLEYQQNESRRHIRLLDLKYLNNIEEDFKRVMK